MKFESKPNLADPVADELHRVKLPTRIVRERKVVLSRAAESVSAAPRHGPRQQALSGAIAEFAWQQQLFREVYQLIEVCSFVKRGEIQLAATMARSLKPIELVILEEASLPALRQLKASVPAVLRGLATRCSGAALRRHCEERAAFLEEQCEIEIGLRARARR